MSDTSSFNLLISTFRHPYIFSLTFDPAIEKLALEKTHEVVGGHGWIDLSPDARHLYATVWGDPPKLAAYDVITNKQNGEHSTRDVSLNALNTVEISSLSGYVVRSKDGRYLFSASASHVDVFPLNPLSGKIIVDSTSSSRKGGNSAIQTLSLLDNNRVHKEKEAPKEFGGLRSGGHSADLSPDGTKLYVADIGRNCVHVYEVDTVNYPTKPVLRQISKNIAKRPHDGPRHTWPHPNGKIVYSLQENSSFVDVLEVTADGSLEWRQGVSILPPSENCEQYWADEVRLSPSCKTLFASTRGLESQTLGWVAAYHLDPKTGYFLNDDNNNNAYAYCNLFRTSTSGGWANAIAPCPKEYNGVVYLSLTDSDKGFLEIIKWDENNGFKSVAKQDLSVNGEPVKAAIAVWF